MRNRIIPARAGFTHAGSRPDRAPQDHPRSRGVYRACSARWRATPGSSPLARGLRDAVEVDRHGGGIIPARAGFTAGNTILVAADQDHPRSRGVYRRRGARMTAAFGSSPLARGLRPAPGDQGLHGGIIPARAGFTPGKESTWDVFSDHPRSRGVYEVSSGFALADWGSSPLARGLQGGRLRPPPPHRIIPARAGFTGTGGPHPRRLGDHPRSRGVYGWRPPGPGA